MSKSITILSVSFFMLLALSTYRIFMLNNRYFNLGPDNCKDLDCYRNCLMRQFLSHPTIEPWDKLPQMLDDCKYATVLPPLVSYPNLDEIKYAVSPVVLSKDEECNIVTLGIGRDIRAEIKMKMDFPEWCRFNGADPISEVNKDLYENIGGVYHETSVGANSAFRNSYVLLEGNYTEKEVKHVEFTEFLEKCAKIQKVVDVLLIDIEAAEYEILSLLGKSGRLELNNITICQYNIEFHWPSKAQKQLFAQYLADTIDDGTFLPLKASKPDQEFCRMYVLNVGDEICIRRYLPKN